MHLQHTHASVQVHDALFQYRRGLVTAIASRAQSIVTFF